MTTKAPVPDPGPDLFALLAEAGRQAGAVWPGYEFELIGRPKGKGRPVRLPCPKPRSPSPPAAAGETNADVILQVLSEADRPLTVVELAYRARAGEPTGAMRDALRKLVRDGRVRELTGPPRQYELP
jgi:hypothetical protein